MFVVQATAGMGKSVAMAELVRRGHTQLAGSMGTITRSDAVQFAALHFFRVGTA